MKIGGTSPLLMNAYPMVTIEGLDKKPPEAQAEAHLYLHPGSGKICVPGVNVQRGLVAAAAFSKGKGRASLAKIAAAAVFAATSAVQAFCTTPIFTSGCAMPGMLPQFPPMKTMLLSRQIF